MSLQTKMNIFTEISILFTIAALVAIVMRVLKQPLIIGYIVTGALIGPALFNVVHSPEDIEILGKFGITLLLFIVGLGLNPKIIKEVGKVSLIGGFSQVLFTIILGFFSARMLGLTTVPSLVVGTALAFSSTIIILKLIGDKKEQNKLYAKISIGFLLVQDILATIALIVTSAAGSGGFSFSDLGNLAAKGFGLAFVLYAVSRLIIKPMTGFLSRSQEMLFLFAIAWGFGVSTLFYKIGFSIEVGALFAGVALASMSYAQEISSRLRPLRDFFIVVFFIALGTNISFDGVGVIAWKAIILSVFVLVIKPVIILIIMGLLGYTKKTSFKTSASMAQVSEFSLILALLASSSEIAIIDQQTTTLITITAVITIALSSYMIIYSDSFFATLEKKLGLFERRKVKLEQESGRTYEAIIFGFRKGGREFVKALQSVKKKIVVIDYDPDVIDELERKNIHYVYGDATDVDLLEEVGIERAHFFVSTISDFPTNKLLLQQIISSNPRASFICNAESAGQAAQLYEEGAAYVMMPHTIGTEKLTSFVQKHGFSRSEFKKFRERHLKYIEADIKDDEVVKETKKKIGHIVLEKISSTSKSST